MLKETAQSINLTTAESHVKNKPVIEDSRPLTLQQQQRFNVNGNTASYYWLNVAQLTQSEVQQKIQQLMQEHHILRTRFVEPQGFTTLRQCIEEAPRLHWHTLAETYDDRETAKKTIEKDALQDYYSKQPHLLVAYYSPSLENKHSGADKLDQNYLLLMGSSLALDDGSAVRIHQYLMGKNIDDIEMQYTDYGEWVNQLQHDEDAEEATHYWQSFNFEKFPPLILNERALREQSVNKREGVSNTTYKCLSYLLPTTICEQLNKKSTELTAEPQLIALTVWAALLSKLSGLNTIYLDYYHDARNNYEELDEILGVFSQALPIPFYNIDISSLEPCVSGLSALFDEHIEYQEYVGKIAPTSKVGFQYHLQQSDIVRASNSSHHSSDLFLYCGIKNNEDTIRSIGELQLYFNSDLYSESAMERALQHYCLLLEQALLSPNKPLLELPCLLADERPQNKEVNTIPMSENTLLDGIYQHVLKIPTATAIRYNDVNYSYQELWALTDKLAGNLQHLGAKPETIVAICLPRSADFLLCLLAVLKTGAAYLPIDPALPQLRKAHIIADAKPVITVSHNQDAYEQDTEDKLKVIDWSELVKGEEALKPISFNENQLAYVLYTSGSSGLPKGVQVTHRSIMHYSLSAISALDLPKKGHYGLISSLMADLGNTMLFPAWLQGGTLHLLSQDIATDGQLFAEYHQQFPIDCLKIVPSHFAALLSGNTAALLPKHSLILGGEKIDDSLLKKLQHYQEKNTLDCRVYNHYGPTETTVGVLWSAVNVSSKATTAPLDYCLGNNHMYLLDEHLSPAITGQVCELYISGPNVTRGYLNATAKTAEHYLPDPFSKHGQRMYRTGDLVMRDANHRINVLGRSDKQIKIRGFRLDLGEIEALLGEYTAIEQASIQVEGSGEQARLIGFYITQRGKKPQQEEILHFLSNNLPDYMVPSQLWAIDTFPLNNNGKLDTQALLLWASQQRCKKYIAASNDMEIAISQVWQDILETDKISIDDNFFDIGGHSLAAIKVVARLRESLGRELPTNIIFQAQTIQALAMFIENNTETQHLQEISVPINVGSNKPQAINPAVPTLVLMHTHGGHLNYYQAIVDALKEEVNIFGLYPDKELLVNAKPEQLNELLTHYYQHLLPLKDTPITLLGWSLAARQVIVLADFLSKQGFTIQRLCLIDYNPNEQLHNKNDEIAQLIDDLQYYIDTSARHHKNQFDDSTWESIKLSLAKQSINDYQQGLRYLLDNGQLGTLIDNKTTANDAINDEKVSQTIPTQWITERVGQKWTLKQMFYAAAIPKVTTPLLVWHSNKNSAVPTEWENYTHEKVTGYRIDADHYTILQSTEFIEQLSKHILTKKIDSEQGIVNIVKSTEKSDLEAPVL